MNRQNEFHAFEKLFWQTSRSMSYLWKDIYDQTFPGSQSHILFLLERDGPKKMSELAQALHLTAGAVTTAADKLIEHAFIARTRNEEDRRVVHVALTEKGRLTLKELQGKGREIMKAVFHDLSDQELKVINDIFKRAAINVDSVEKELNK